MLHWLAFIKPQLNVSGACRHVLLLVSAINPSSCQRLLAFLIGQHASTPCVVRPFCCYDTRLPT